MALPAEATPVTVTELFTDSAGAAEAGTVTFTPTAVVAVGSSTLTRDPIVARVVAGALLAPDGINPLVLAATDDADQQPTGWTYRVDIAVGTVKQPSYYAALPADPPERVLHTLSPIEVPAVTGRPLVRTVNGVFPDAAGNVDVAGGGGGGGVPTTRRITAGTGLTGGGDLSADRTLVVAYGTSASTAARGDDTRLSDARTPLAHTHAQSEVTGLPAALSGKATKKTIMPRVVTSGSIALNTAGGAWAALSGAPTLSMPAAVGDLIVVELGSVMRTTGSSNKYLDIAVVVSGALRRMLGNGQTGTPVAVDAAYEGMVLLYHTNFPAGGGRLPFVATSNDIDGSGNVTVTFAARSVGSDSPVLCADTANPLVWALANEGAVTVL
jgi:hypothetical protein